MGIIDTKLGQVATICLALTVAKLFPEILTLSVWLWVVLGVVCAIKPVITFFGSGHDAPSAAEG